MKIRSLIGIGVAALTGAAGAQPAGTEFVSAGLFSQTANFLDDSFNVLGTFDTGGSPNGAAVGGGQIFIGDFGIPGWNVYNIDGTFVQTVTAGASQQGITYANGDILIQNAGTPALELYTTGGTFIRTVANVALTVEGVAFDGNNTVYALDSSAIDAYDFTTGALQFSLSNPASNETFGGTAMTYRNGSLFVGAESGNWWEIDALNGSILDSGNGNTDLFGLAVIPAPGPAALLGLAGLAAARRRR